jgi:hypothetical protein
MMIRLTLNAKTDPEIHLFNKPIISLGSDPAAVDLILSGIAIAPIHLKIIEQDGFRIIINLTNDPFVSVNGTPFGKKLLNSGDVIIVHETIILFEKLITAGSSNSLNPQEPTALPLTENSTVSKKHQSQPLSPPFQTSSFPLPFEDEITSLMESDFEKNYSDLSAKEEPLLNEELNSTTDPIQKNSKKALHANQAKKSLKDDYLQHLEEGQPSQEMMENDPNERTHLYYAWKWILVFIFSLISTVVVLGVIVYLNVNDKSEAQETKAAQAVADIAMALTYAEINQLKPQNQNWADADFLKAILQGILPNTPSYASQIDAQGQFNLCAYSLRIYTNSDLSHFLLIAQPAHSFLQWFVPKKVIVVDSKLMELRTLNDVKSLNRLLASPDPLEGLNGNEILELVKQGTLIRLPRLANYAGNFDFAPPKNLAWILPQAENLIYNAPRYWRLGKNLVDEALNLSTSRGSSQEVAKLKSNVEAFAHLPHLVLYSDQGKKSALHTKEGLMMFAPTDNFLFGFVGFNAQGKINQSTLLKDDDVKETIIATSIKGGDVNRNSSEELAYESAPLDLTKNHHQADRRGVDHNHPIFIQLQSVSIARENELKPLVSALFSLVNHELQSPDPQFQIEFQHLSHSFLMLDAKQKEIVKENIDYLFHKYDDIPIDQFIGFLKELNLQHLIQQDEDTISLIDENCQQNMGSMISQIEKTTSLIELDNLIHIASTWLNFDYIKDPQELIAFRNKLRNQLLVQLEKFILCPDKHLSFKADDRPILEHILYQERLVKPEEREFLISEFENALPNANLAEEEL